MNTWHFNLLINKSIGPFQSSFFLTFLWVNHSLAPWLSRLPGFPHTLWSCDFLLTTPSLCPLANFPSSELWLLKCGYTSDFMSPSLVLSLILKKVIRSQDCCCCHQAEDFQNILLRISPFHFLHTSCWIFCHYPWTWHCWNLNSIFFHKISLSRESQGRTHILLWTLTPFWWHCLHLPKLPLLCVFFYLFAYRENCP